MSFFLNAREYKEYKEVMKRNQSLEIQHKELIREFFDLKEKEKNTQNEFKKLEADTEVIKERLLAKEKEVDTKLKELEELIKTEQEKEKVTKAQKMLLLEFLGVLDIINSLDIQQGDKMKLLGYIINAHEKNIEKDFNGRGFHLDSPLSKLVNYNFLVKIFNDLGMKEQEDQAQRLLNQIKNKKS